MLFGDLFRKMEEDGILDCLNEVEILIFVFAQYSSQELMLLLTRSLNVVANSDETEEEVHGYIPMSSLGYTDKEERACRTSWIKLRSQRL